LASPGFDKSFIIEFNFSIFSYLLQINKNNILFNKAANFMKKTNIQIQYFNGCPNSSEMIYRVKTAIAGIEEEIDYEEVLIETNESAEKMKFRGSPTLLINGKDYEGQPEPIRISLSCRFYPDGLPTVQEIKKRITENQ
jgi:glutaredoxin